MSEKPKTAIERVQEEAAKLGVQVEVVEPKPGSGTLTFLAREPSEDKRPE